MTKVLILGADGYLGWPLCLHLARNGYDIGMIDSLAKRGWEQDFGVRPLLALPTWEVRRDLFEKYTKGFSNWTTMDIATEPHRLYTYLEWYKPAAIVHLAEQPSAPLSMATRGAAVDTQVNNVVGTLNLMFAVRHACPETHIVKMGTMGEYGTPNIDIEEGWLDVTHKGRSDRVLFPKRPGSFYHLSKVHDSHNMEFGCRIWGLRVTDLNQGVVYGANTRDTGGYHYHTSFHYDQLFGTVLNRFIVQAVLGEPLSIYGSGEQQRGFINIVDTMRCIELAIENPAEEREFRVFNQFTEVFSIRYLAERVKNAAEKEGITVEYGGIENPRVEAPSHYYNPVNDEFAKLGLSPTLLTQNLIRSMLDYVAEFKKHIDPSTIPPTVKWSR